MSRIALRRKPLRQQYGVALELDVEVVHHGNVAPLHDGHVVDQQLGRDQFAIDQQAVIRREQHIAPRQIFAECAATDHHRRHEQFRTGMRGDTDAALANPFTGCGTRASPTSVMTMSPAAMSSTGFSPSDIRIRVPAA